MYELNYGHDGRVICIKEISTGTCISICEENPKYQEFLIWNKAQPIPLDLNSTIEVVKPEPARDLAKEIDLIKVDITNLKKVE